MGSPRRARKNKKAGKGVRRRRLTATTLPGRTCPQCGNIFYPDPTYPEQKTCGRRCGALAHAREQVEAEIDRLLALKLPDA